MHHLLQRMNDGAKSWVSLTLARTQVASGGFDRATVAGVISGQYRRGDLGPAALQAMCRLSYRVAGLVWL
jgi:hypothetical protein